MTNLEEHLRASAPEIRVDTETALHQVETRGRARRQRRHVAVGATALLVVVVGVGAVAAVERGDSTSAPVYTDGDQSPDAPQSTEPGPLAGDPAVWKIDPAAPPNPDSSTFTALVTRLGCNSGDTGPILDPVINATDGYVSVTFTVESNSGGGRCPTNDFVPVTVDIGAPLGWRTISDGACVPGQEAATTSECLDSGIRWNYKRGGPGPTDYELQEAHDRSVECLTSNGLDVRSSQITITYYDVGWRSEVGPSAMNQEETDTIRADCQKELQELTSAWMSGKDMRDDEVFAALRRCMADRGHDSIEFEQLTDEKSFTDRGYCMQASRDEVYGAGN